MAHAHAVLSANECVSFQAFKIQKITIDAYILLFPVSIFSNLIFSVNNVMCGHCLHLVNSFREHFPIVIQF